LIIHRHAQPGPDRGLEHQLQLGGPVRLAEKGPALPQRPPTPAVQRAFNPRRLDEFRRRGFQPDTVHRLRQAGLQQQDRLVGLQRSLERLGPVHRRAHGRRPFEPARRFQAGVIVEPQVGQRGQRGVQRVRRQTDFHQAGIRCFKGLHMLPAIRQHRGHGGQAQPKHANTKQTSHLKLSFPSARR
jgi:hypothetical protein